MPCSFCGENGHNRRTCQRWDLVLLARVEEEQRIENEQRIIVDLTAPVQNNIPRTPPRTNVIETPLTPERPNRRSSIHEFISPYDIYNSIYGNENTLLDDDLIQSPPVSNPVCKPAPTIVDSPIATEDCAICMEKLTSANLFIGPCGHQFHAMCMVQHIKTRSNCLCPLCRVELHS
mgnify:CR=1 FL=1